MPNNPPKNDTPGSLANLAGSRHNQRVDAVLPTHAPTLTTEPFVEAMMATKPISVVSPISEAPDPVVIWAAGFFDGEGCVTVPFYRRGKGGPLAREQYGLQVTVTQNRVDPLNLFLRWGGRVTRMTSPKDKKLIRPVLRWICEGSTALAFLEDVEPWLVVKAPLVPLARELQATMRLGARRTPAETAEVLATRADIKARVQAFNGREVPNVGGCAERSHGKAVA